MWGGLGLSDPRGWCQDACNAHCMLYSTYPMSAPFGRLVGSTAGVPVGFFKGILYNLSLIRFFFDKKKTYFSKINISATIGSWTLNFFVESDTVLKRSFPGSFVIQVPKRYSKKI